MINLNWENCINENRNEIVFEKRNKEFGAFPLRNGYKRTLTIAFIVSAASLILLVCIPLISSFFRDASDKLASFSDTEITLMQPPPIDESEPPPPVVPPPPPVQQTIKFTPPVIVKDEEVPVDEPPPTMDELKDVSAGLTTQEGDPNAIDLPIEDPGQGDAVPEIFTIVEEMPMFPGGEEALVKYLSNNIKYPARARENNITGTVFVTFKVGKDGKVTESQILRGIGGGCDEEALRVIKSMPSWRAGRQRGEPVIVQYNLPIKFSLK
ncbi:MAG: TonB family protein [Bacteroidetes bacterium]|nr:TonB family protein [Bacteroidota bacterium]